MFYRSVNNVDFITILSMISNYESIEIESYEEKNGNTGSISMLKKYMQIFSV